jgi:tRNA-dihydrouridine synthase B
MEDVSDAVFRRICRGLGAELCITEFVRVDALAQGSRAALLELRLEEADQPTAIQIHGSNPEYMARAAALAEGAAPAFIDINCGCAIPRIARRGAGAGWLKDPVAMVRMAALVVASTSLPVTVKTRLGYGDPTDMPIVDLARRLEDAGIQALTLHCRTARMGFGGAADWSRAAAVRGAVSLPVIVNGDVRTAGDAERALRETGCEGVMVGRRAIEHPWIFREARALLDRGLELPPPAAAERLALYRETLLANVASRGERAGVPVTRRHLTGYLEGLCGAQELRRSLLLCATLQGSLEILEGAWQRLAT